MYNVASSRWKVKMVPLIIKMQLKLHRLTVIAKTPRSHADRPVDESTPSRTPTGRPTRRFQPSDVLNGAVKGVSAVLRSIDRRESRLVETALLHFELLPHGGRQTCTALADIREH